MANSDALISGVLPMTMVTAMVSPSTRARPSRAAPKMPFQLYGRMNFQMACQRVAPRA